VVHFDETGGRVGARLRWIHVMCTDRWTLYHLDDRRGKSARSTLYNRWLGLGCRGGRIAIAVSAAGARDANGRYDENARSTQ
jgi:hypothetical protein